MVSRISKGSSMAGSTILKLDGNSDVALVADLASRGYRPNILIACTEADAEILLSQVMASLAPPLHFCPVPGDLQLPAITAGTLLLRDVAALTPLQQVILNDWLGAVGSDVRVVSVTKASVVSLVEKSEFDARLFYRLNIVLLDNLNGGRQEGAPSP
jgi:hypothetical protein